MTELCEMVGGPILKKASSVDLTKRILLIDAIVELLLADTIEAQDIEDLIDDYMELNFHTKCEEIDDHLEIGQILCGPGIMANNTEHKLLKTRMGRKKKVNGFKVK